MFHASVNEKNILYELDQTFFHIYFSNLVYCLKTERLISAVGPRMQTARRFLSRNGVLPARY